MDLYEVQLETSKNLRMSLMPFIGKISENKYDLICFSMYVYENIAYLYV